MVTGTQSTWHYCPRGAAIQKDASGVHDLKVVRIRALGGADPRVHKPTLWPADL